MEREKGEGVEERDVKRRVGGRDMGGERSHKWWEFSILILKLTCAKLN